MQSIIVSLASALKRVRAKNVRLQHLLDTCHKAKDRTRQIIHHLRKAG